MPDLMIAEDKDHDVFPRVDTMGDADDSPTAPADLPGAIVTLTFRRSASFARMADAMSQAQGLIVGASKDNVNPHFKSKYADLAAVWDACRAPLSANGIAVFQPPCADGPSVTVTTLLAHKSGEWIESDLTMLAAQNTPQGIGSCITYARRYALSAMVGVAPEDDDGNAASQRSGNGHAAEAMSPSELPPARAFRAAPDGFEDWWTDLQATADNGLSAMEAAWKTAKPEYKTYASNVKRDAITAMKKKASRVAAS